MLNSHAIYIEKLTPEYRKIFRQVSDYVNSESIDEIKREEILSEVLDSFLSAQEDGRPADIVIGGDLRSFCEQLCSEVGVKSRFVNIAELLCPIFLISLMLSVIDVISMVREIADGGSTDLFHYRASGCLWAYLLGGSILVISDLITKMFIKKMMFSSPEKYKKLSKIIRVISVAVIFAVFVFIFSGKKAEGTYLWLNILICSAYLLFYRTVTRESRRYRKENAISFGDLPGYSVSLKKSIDEMEMKRFEMQNSRNAKKGLPEITFADFLEREKKDCSRFDKKPAFFVLIVVVSTVCGFLFTLLSGGFEKIHDAYFFIGILLILESIIMYIIYRFARAGVDARLEWIRSKSGSV